MKSNQIRIVGGNLTTEREQLLCYFSNSKRALSYLGGGLEHHSEISPSLSNNNSLLEGGESSDLGAEFQSKQ